MRCIVVLACLLVLNGASCNILNSLDISTGNVKSAGTATVCVGDLFPDKATVNFGAKFSITYNGSFKLLTNHEAKKTYLLVQRGCTPPVGVTADLTVYVPVTQVIVQSSTFVRWIELFGERNTIIGVNGLYTSSPCLNKRFSNQQTLDFSSNVASYNQSGFFLNSGASTTGTLYASKVDVTLVSQYSDTGPNPLYVSSDSEPTWQANAEWSKYVGALYNEEATITQFSTNSRSNWICASKQGTPALVKARKTAVWATGYFPNYGGFSFAKCPSKHCDLITAAGLQLLDGESFTGKGDNMAQVAAWMQNVDFLFIADNNCAYKNMFTVEDCDDLWLKTILGNLSSVKAVQDKKVWDIGRKVDPSGGTDFFYSVPAEPDVLLNDVVTVTAGATGHRLAYLRNMLTEGVGDLRTCTKYPGAVGCRPTEAELASLCPAETQGAAVTPMSTTQGSIACPASSSAAKGPGPAALAAFALAAAALTALATVH